MPGEEPIIVVPDVIPSLEDAVMERLINKLLRKVNFPDNDFQFEREELEDEIEEAMVLINPNLTLLTMTSHDELLVMYKSRSACYYTLASKHAEGMRFKVENDEYFGDQPFRAYLALAEKYKALFEENVGIQVNTVTRTQTGTGLKAPYYLGDMP